MIPFARLPMTSVGPAPAPPAAGFADAAPGASPRMSLMFWTSVSQSWLLDTTSMVGGGGPRPPPPPPRRAAARGCATELRGRLRLHLDVARRADEIHLVGAQV